MKKLLLALLGAVLLPASIEAATILTSLGRFVPLPSLQRSSTPLMVVDGWAVTCETGQQPQRATFYFTYPDGHWALVPTAGIEWRRAADGPAASLRAQCPYVGPYIGLRLTVAVDPTAAYLAIVWDDYPHSIAIDYLPIQPPK